MAEFPCKIVPQDVLAVRTGALDQCAVQVLITDITGRTKSVYLTPEDALRFAKAVLDVADEAAGNPLPEDA